MLRCLTNDKVTAAAQKLFGLADSFGVGCSEAKRSEAERGGARRSEAKHLEWRRLKNTPIHPAVRTEVRNV
jgi:hypothetical protein